MDQSPGFIKLVDDAKKRINEISIEEVAGLQNSGDNFFLIDIREEHEWAIDRIPGAIFLARGILEREIEKVIPDENSLIILYCAGAYRSALSAENLQKMGYKNVFSMAGGIKLWREKNFPIDE